MKMFEVGGCVRDEILGVQSKDIDFSVVLTPEEMHLSAVGPYETMVARLSQQGIRIIRNEKTGVIVGEEHLTARGIHPTRGAVDFVLARKESGYSDGRRPDSVEVGTLEDDLRRRDFTMNAIAKDAEGNLIDLFDGVQDINDRVIRAVGSAFERLTEDALRAVRALRFSVTKGFRIDHEVKFAMQSAAVLDSINNNISDERIKDELSKMLRFDSLASITAMNQFPLLTEAMLSGSVSLDSTMKTKGRG